MPLRATDVVIPLVRDLFVGHGCLDRMGKRLICVGHHSGGHLLHADAEGVCLS